jgi:hypothetical protein
MRWVVLVANVHATVFWKLVDEMSKIPRKLVGIGLEMAKRVRKMSSKMTKICWNKFEMSKIAKKWKEKL